MINKLILLFLFSSVINTTCFAQNEIKIILPKKAELIDSLFKKERIEMSYELEKQLISNSFDINELTFELITLMVSVDSIGNIYKIDLIRNTSTKFNLTDIIINYFYTLSPLIPQHYFENGKSYNLNEFLINIYSNEDNELIISFEN